MSRSLMHFRDLTGSEDYRQTALQIATQSIDCHHNERATVGQSIVRLEQQLIEGIVPSLCGQVGNYEFVRSDGLTREVANAIAERPCCVAQVISCGVAGCGFDCADICVDHVDLRIRPASGQCQSNCTVTATKVEDSRHRRKLLEFSEQQSGAFIERSGGK